MEKVSIKNYFDYFNLDMSFDIDITSLDDYYLDLQSKNHPDCFLGKGSEEKKIAQGCAILINQAYKTLRSPLKRAEYLLSLLLKKCDSIKPSQELLMEALEMREKSKRDDPFLNGSYNDCVENIRKAFSNNDLIGMAHHTMRLKYITKIKEDICN